MTDKTDQLIRFLIEHTPARGEIVQLERAWQAIRTVAAYPAPVQELLGQAVAAAILLSATIKIKGQITIQAQGDGPVKMLVVHCTNEREVRAMASWDGEIQPGNLESLFGAGHLAITIDQEKASERFQGIVVLEGNDLAQAIQNYFDQSEQLETRLWLAADENVAAGLMLQKLPEALSDDEGWNRVQILAETVKAEELLELDPEETLRRLFHEEVVRVFDAELCAMRCTCSRHRIEGVLRSMGRPQLVEMLNEDPLIVVDCEYCGHQYKFDSIDVECLLTSDSVMAPKTRQ